MSINHELRTASEGGRWPSGSYIEAAIVSVDLLSIAEKFNSQIVYGSEPGMGDWRSVGFIRDGNPLELLEYLSQSSEGVEIRVDAENSARDVLKGIMNDLGFDENAVMWVNPALK